MPELSISVTPARFTAMRVEPPSTSSWILLRNASSASPSFNGPSRSRMVAWPALRIPMFTCASLRFAKLSELCPAIKGLRETSWKSAVPEQDVTEPQLPGGNACLQNLYNSLVDSQFQLKYPAPVVNQLQLGRWGNLSVLANLIS